MSQWEQAGLIALVGSVSVFVTLGILQMVTTAIGLAWKKVQAQKADKA